MVVVVVVVDDDDVVDVHVVVREVGINPFV